MDHRINVPHQAFLPQDAEDLAAQDPYHRYELSAHGILNIGPLPEDHERDICERIAAWLSRVYSPELISFDRRVQTNWAEGSRKPDMTYSAPDGVTLVVEVVSYHTQFVDQVEKRTEYATSGIPHYWLIWPDDNSDWCVTEYHLHDGRYREVNPMRVTLDEFLSTPVPTFDKR